MKSINPGIIPLPVLETEGLTHGSLPLSRELWGALLYVDVSGFTRITEYANSKGHYGIEIVTEVLNNYFEKLASLVYAKGGYIVKYGGDSCLSIFPYHRDTRVLLELGKQIDSLCDELDRDYRHRYGFGFEVHGGGVYCPFTICIVGDRQFHADYFIYSPMLAKLYNQIETTHAKGIMPPRYELPNLLESPVPSSNVIAQPEMFLSTEVVTKLQKEAKPAELRNAVVIFVQILPESGDMIPIDAYHEFYIIVQKWVYEFGGVVNKIDYTDKGYLLIALFGVPKVHPDDVERAFLCALRITQIHYSKVSCRIGITSSNIYCGVIGSSLRYEYGIIGNAVNIAARLMSQAESGQIALSADILPAIASRFKTRFVQSAKVKGIKDPIQIHLLESELPEHWAIYNDRFRDLPLLLSDLQRDTINDFLGSSDALMLSITGKKGTGKSFLIWQLWNVLNLNKKHPEISIVDRKSQSLRLEFFFSLCRRKLGISTFRIEFERITELAIQNNLDWNDVIIRRYLFPGADGNGGLKAEEIAVAKECVIGLCLYLLKEHDSLLVDNCDLYDNESKLILQQVILRFLASGKKIAISSEEDDCVAVEGFPVLALALEELSPEQSQALLNHTLPLITHQAKALLHDISSGNPQFLIGMVEQIRSKYDTSSDLISDNTIIDLQAKGIISINLENMLMANYEALDADSKRLLRYAAVYGRPFAIADLRKAFAIEEHFPMQDTIAFLRKEMHLELLLSDNEPRFSFSNPILRDCIYRSVLLSDKKEYHHQIANSLAAIHSQDDDDLQSIVYHYLQAEDKEALVTWSKKAAERFYIAGAWDTSRRFYSILSNWSDAKEEINAAKLKLAELSLLQADNKAAKEILDAMPELQGEQAETAIYLNTIYLNNTAAYASLQDYLKDKLPNFQNPNLKSLVYVFYLESMLYDNQQGAFFKEALAAYPKLEGTPDLQNRLAGVIAQAYMNQGDYRFAYEFYEKKRELATKLIDGLGLRIALNGMGGACYRMGKKAKAWELYQEALEVAEQTGDRNGYSKVMLNLGVSLKSEMRYEEAWECYSKALLLAKKMGNLMQESILIYDMGEMLFLQDRFEEALNLFRQSLDLSIRINDNTGISFCNDAIGDSYFKGGDYARAEQTYLENLKLQIKINDREGIAHTWGNLGNCAKIKKNFPEARKFYYKQFKLLSKVQDWDGAGRSRFNLAMINKEQKLYKRALAQLRIAHEFFTRCQAEYYLQICATQQAEINKLIMEK